MQYQHIRDVWFKFSQKYSQFFKSNEETWMDRLMQCQAFVDKNGKLPYLTNSDPEAKQLAKWLYHQTENYKAKKEGLKNEELRRMWEEFVRKNPCRKFMTQEEYWLITFNQLQAYVQKNNKLPKKYKETRVLASWTNRQINNYKNKCESMSNL